MATERQPSGFTEAVQHYAKDGAVIGAAAFVLNYVVMYLFAVIDGVEGTAEVGLWKAVGWVFYAAHMVDMELSVSGGGQSLTETINLFEQTDTTQNLTSTIPEMVYYLAPVVVLLGAGYVLYNRTDVSLNTEAAAGLGATIVAGYVVLAVVGTFLFEASLQQAGASASIAPELTTAILITGVVYPLVLGAIGAVAASSS